MGASQMRVIRRTEVFGLSNWVEEPFPEMGKPGEEQVGESVGGVRNHLSK